MSRLETRAKARSSIVAGWAAIALGAVFSALPLTGASAIEKTLTVVIDKAHLVNLPQGTATLIIGNPTIADVTMIGTRSSVMVLTPKAFGETNFIALDNAGKQLDEELIRVVAGTDTLVVQRGMERQSYACSPKCQATEKLGDDNKFFNDTVAQNKAYNSSVTSAPAPVQGTFMNPGH